MEAQAYGSLHTQLGCAGTTQQSIQQQGVHHGNLNVIQLEHHSQSQQS